MQTINKLQQIQKIDIAEIIKTLINIEKRASKAKILIEELDRKIIDRVDDDTKKIIRDDFDEIWTLVDGIFSEL